MKSAILSLLLLGTSTFAVPTISPANAVNNQVNDAPVEQLGNQLEQQNVRNSAVNEIKTNSDIEKRNDHPSSENVKQEDIEKESDDDKLIRYLEGQEGIRRSLIDDVFKNDASDEYKTLGKRADTKEREQRVSEESVDENALEQEDDHLPASKSIEEPQEMTENEEQSVDDKSLQKRGIGLDGFGGVGFNKFGGSFGCGCRPHFRCGRARRLRCFHRVSRIDRWTCQRTFPTRVTWSFVFNKCSRFPIGKLIIVRKGCAVHVFLKRFGRCRRTVFPVCFRGRRFRKCGVLRNRFIGGGFFGVGKFGLGCGGCGGCELGGGLGFGGKGCGCPVRFGFGGLGGLRCGKFFPGKF